MYLIHRAPVQQHSLVRHVPVFSVLVFEFRISTGDVYRAVMCCHPGVGTVRTDATRANSPCVQIEHFRPCSRRGTSTCFEITPRTYRYHTPLAHDRGAMGPTLWRNVTITSPSLSTLDSATQHGYMATTLAQTIISYFPLSPPLLSAWGVVKSISHDNLSLPAPYLFPPYCLPWGGNSTHTG